MDMKTDAASVISGEDIFARHDYALVDRQMLDPEPWREALPLQVLVPKALRGDEEKMPGLISLRKLNSEQIERLAANLQAAKERREPRFIACLLTVGDEPPYGIGIHMTRRLLMHTPDGRYFLRYYDPRVFVHLSRIFPVTLFAALYGPLTHWSIPFQDEWITLPYPETPLRREFWSLDAEQRLGIGRILPINRALAYWAEDHGPWKNLDHYRAAAECADRLVEQAIREHGIEGGDALIEFTLDGLTAEL
jgi:hypothetical protein